MRKSKNIFSPLIGKTLDHGYVLCGLNSFVFRLFAFQEKRVPFKVSPKTTLTTILELGTGFKFYTWSFMPQIMLVHA